MLGKNFCHPATSMLLAMRACRGPGEGSVSQSIDPSGRAMKPSRLRPMKTRPVQSRLITSMTPTGLQVRGSVKASPGYWRAGASLHSERRPTGRPRHLDRRGLAVRPTTCVPGVVARSLQTTSPGVALGCRPSSPNCLYRLTHFKAVARVISHVEGSCLVRHKNAPPSIEGVGDSSNVAGTDQSARRGRDKSYPEWYLRRGRSHIP